MEHTDTHCLARMHATCLAFGLHQMEQGLSSVLWARLHLTTPHLAQCLVCLQCRGLWFKCFNYSGVPVNVASTQTNWHTDWWMDWTELSCFVCSAALSYRDIKGTNSEVKIGRRMKSLMGDVSGKGEWRWFWKVLEDLSQRAHSGAADASGLEAVLLPALSSCASWVLVFFICLSSAGLWDIVRAEQKKALSTTFYSP